MTEGEQAILSAIADQSKAIDKLTEAVTQVTLSQSPGAIRQRRYIERKRHTNDATPAKKQTAAVTQDEHISVTDVTPVGGRGVNVPLFLEEGVTDDPVSHGTGNGSSPTSSTGKKDTRGRSAKTVTTVTLDMDRAQADAAKRGLTDAAFDAELERFTNYWDSAGWKRKGGPITDRNAAWRSWLDSDYRTYGKAAATAKNPDYSGIKEWGERMKLPAMAGAAQTDIRNGWKVLTHDYRSPIQGGEPLFDGTCPFTLPKVELSKSQDAHA